MKTVYKLSLELSVPEFQSLIRCHVGEGLCRSVEAEFTFFGKAFSLKEVKNAVIRGMRQDGSFVFNDCTISGDKVYYTFTDSFLSVAGKTECQFSLYDKSGNLLSSPKFILEVLPLVISDEIIKGENDSSAFFRALSDARSAADSSKQYAEKTLASHENAAELIKNASDQLEMANRAVEEYLHAANEALSAPPVLLASGTLEESKSDIRKAFSEKVYGEITIYITVPPTAASQNWGFYTYFDSDWVMHVREGLLSDRYSNIRLSARYDGGQWVLNSSSYFNADSESVAWSANAQVNARGKNKKALFPFIESLRFVTDYKSGSSPSQIPFPKGTKWEIYGRRVPESLYLSPIKKTDELYRKVLKTVAGGQDEISISVDPLKKAIILLETETAESLGADLYIDGKEVMRIQNLALGGGLLRARVDISYNGFDFDTTLMKSYSQDGVEWTEASLIYGSMKTDFFESTEGIINRLTLLAHEGKKFPEGTKITVYGVSR